jgi:hypothetical protein
MTRTYRQKTDTMKRFCLILSGLCCLGVSPLAASELRSLPAEVALTGQGATQRVLVVAEENGQVVADLTPKSEFISSDEKVARVSSKGVIQAVGDGEAIVSGWHDGVRAKTKVKVSGTKQATTPSFRNQVIPILTRAGCNSGACHGALAGKGGLKLSLRGYDPDADHFVLTRQALGRRVDLQHPERSLFLKKPTFAVNHGGGKKLDVESPEFAVLAEWIAGGAPRPKTEDVSVTRLEVFPTAAVLKPKDQLQVLVRAWHSDGSTRDVTRWAKFSSSEEQVANVSDEGLATVAGHGEAAITVWYSNFVAAARILSPFPNQVAGDVFTKAARHKYIDDLVLKKLQALRLPPSPLCDDRTFVRRAFLDATGTLPTPQEVEKFVADARNDKRAQLIDSLLERPEFIDYWTHKWSDLLLVSTRKLPQSSVWAFHQHIRQSVADNKPWDRFARELLTAQGSTLENGAANYFALHRDVTDLTESTSVTFLGMSITCCRCHNHPLEKWTQDQYWRMANLFSRVGLKNGERSGEVVVQSQPEGEAPHPRRGVPMPPTPLDGKPLAPDSRIDRRAYFADWLTAKENPYFAKALVNRVWRNFLGRGLVEAEDDLRQTNPPTNPELFDALAEDFIEHRYDVKHLIRTIMTSATYQRSSRPLPENRADDRFYSRYLVRRLSAEVILDAYSQVTGVPTLFKEVNVGSSGGTAATAMYPLGTRALQLPDSQLVSPFLDAFGRPERVQTCSCERQQDSSVGQALHLNNGKTLNDKLRDKKSRVEAWLTEKVSDEEAIRRIYQLALSREPTAGEKKKFLDLLAEAVKDTQPSRREALEDLFWAVLTSKEFVFNR